MKVEIYYCLTYTNGQYVALDANSGGYPYPVNSITSAKLWKTKDEADAYPVVGEVFTTRKVEIKIEY